MTRPGLTRGKDVSDQLIIDSDRYRSAHPDCKMLGAFVYDPQEYLINPSGVEHDLTKTINGVPVKVIIRSR
jgi:REase_DpnII-MboI